MPSYNESLVLLLLINIISLMPFTSFNDIEVEVLDNVYLCQSDCVKLEAEITGDSDRFFWTSDLGYFNDSELEPEVCVNDEEHFIFTAFSSNIGPNIIDNGSFESGNSGFTTDYGFEPCAPNTTGILLCEGSYTIGDDSGTTHSNFASCGPQDGSEYMIINGSAALQSIWCQDVVVNPFSKYYFSAWAVSVISTSPANLQFSIDGNILSNNLNLSSSTCNWENLEDYWVAGDITTAEICIVNQNTAASGNDFGIDNIFFAELCKDTAHVSVLVKPLETVPSFPNILNCLDSTEVLSVNTLDNTGPYSYNWITDDGNILSDPTLESIDIDSPGEYEVEVTNAFGCTYTEEIEVFSDIELPEIEFIDVQEINCLNPIVIIEAETSVNNVDYEWDGPDILFENDEEIEVDGPGWYSLTVTDNFNFCSDTLSILIQENVVSENVSINSTNNISCQNPSSTLNIDVNQDIQSIIWTYNGDIIDMNNEESISVNEAGNYQVEVVYTNGCQEEDDIIINADVPIFDYSLEGPNLLNCVQDTILLQSNASPTEYTIFWTGPNINNPASPDINIVEAGTYYLELTDVNACVKLDSFDVTSDFTEPELEVFNDTLKCLDNNALLYVNQINAVQQIEWTGPDNQTFFGDSIWVTQAGMYDIVATAASGCTTTYSAQLFLDDDVPQLNVTGPDTINCRRTNALLLGNSTDSLIQEYWINPDNSIQQQSLINVQVPGIYTYVGISNNGCMAQLEHELVIDTFFPAINIPIPNELNCLRPSFQYSFGNNNLIDSLTWTFNDTILSNLDSVLIEQEGLYTLQLQAKNGCRQNLDLQVFSDFEMPEFNLIGDTITCLQPSVEIQVDIDPTINFNIFQDSLTLIQNNNLFTSQAGIFMVTAIGQNGCTTTKSIDIEIDTLRPSSQITGDTINCFKPEIEAIVQTTGTVDSLIWSGPNNFYNNTENPIIQTAGEYFLTIYSPNGCHVNSVIDIPIDTLISAPIVMTDTLNCYQSSISLSNINGLEYDLYQWTIPDSTIVNTSAIDVSTSGMYSLEVTAANGCQSKISTLISEDFSLPSISLLDVDTLDCQRDSVQLTLVTGDQIDSISWDFNGQTIAKDSTIWTTNPGIYTSQIIGNNGCINADSILVLQDTIRPVFQVNTADIDCYNPEANINIVDPKTDVNYELLINGITEGNQTSISTNQGQLISFEATASNGCTHMESYLIQVDTISPIFNLVGGILTCSDSIIDIKILEDLPNHNILWFSNIDSLIDASPNQISDPGVFWAQVQSISNGCISTRSIDITENTNFPELIVLHHNNPNCEDQWVDVQSFDIIGGETPLQVSLNEDPFTDINELISIPVGQNQIQIQDKNGCEIDTSIYIEKIENLTIDPLPDLDINYNTDEELELMLNKQYEDILYVEWIPDLGLSCSDCFNPTVNLSQSQTYLVIVEDIFGCIDSIEISIRIERDFSIFIPNVISPNANDPINQVFKPLAPQNNVQIINSLQIFDRWGERVMIQENMNIEDPLFGWNGQFGADLVQAGVYVYLLEVTFSDGTIEVLTGDVTVIR